MADYRLDFPPDFDEFAGDVESKGWFGAVLTHEGETYDLNVYSPEGLEWDVKSYLQGHRHFFESNLLVVRRLTRQETEDAVADLVGRGRVRELVPASQLRHRLPP